jgi:hypothetical protein
MVITTASARQHVRREGDAAEMGNPSATGESPNQALEYRRVALLVRRLHTLVIDLGLRQILPVDWATPSGNGVAFGELTLHQTDELIRSLEDVTSGRQARTPLPGRGQLTLFGHDV